MSRRPADPADPKKRKHVSTGRPRGGYRPAAGRPAGTFNALPMGTVAALKALRWRVPTDAPEPVADLADEALGTMADVMRGNLDPQIAQSALKAAALVRTEICGPQKTQVEHSGSVSLEQMVLEAWQPEPDPEEK